MTIDEPPGITGVARWFELSRCPSRREGYTMLQLYNSLTRREELFSPARAPTVKIYSCGPTVYARQHLGNMRPYVFADTLRRALSLFGFRTKHVINITDVGHLTDDGDEGEDKLERAAAKHQISAKAIAARFTKLFKEDLAKLNVEPPSVWAAATEHIPEQLELIGNLERRGFTYQTQDGIYFDSSKAERLGQLSRLPHSETEAQERVRGTGGKRRPTDFALWKFSPADKARQMEWESPWGVGFPGWHTECCAMAIKYLGTPIDIHTGGVDHIPVHHENEILQAEAAYGIKRWVATWMHSEWVMFDGTKMAKAAGGAPSLDDVVALGVDPLAYRFLLLGAHYRSRVHFTWKSLRAAANGFRRLRERVLVLATDGHDQPMETTPVRHLDQFKEAIADDLNTPRAFAILFELLDDQSVSNAQKRHALRVMDSVLGLSLGEPVDIEIDDPAAIRLLEEREAARARREWHRADELRAQLAVLGYTVEDTKQRARLTRR